MASERTTQTQTVQQAATNSDGEAPWADLEVAIPSDRNHASLVALVECVLVELTHEQVGAVVVAQQVWGTKRTQYVAVDDVGEQFQKRHFDAGLAGTRLPFLERPFATSSSPKSLGRQSHRRSAHEKQQPASQTRSP